MQQNSYAMEVDKSNRNCYSCKSFEYLARNCKNRENRIEEEIRLEYRSNGNDGQSNLKEEGDLIVFD